MYLEIALFPELLSYSIPFEEGNIFRRKNEVKKSANTRK